MAKSKKFWRNLIGLIVGGGLVIAGAATGKLPLDKVWEFFLNQSDTIGDLIEEGTGKDTGDLLQAQEPAPGERA